MLVYLLVFAKVCFALHVNVLHFPVIPFKVLDSGKSCLASFDRRFYMLRSPNLNKRKILQPLKKTTQTDFTSSSSFWLYRIASLRRIAHHCDRCIASPQSSDRFYITAAQNGSSYQ
jgi:hypothetical protein